MNVVELHPKHDCFDIARALRAIADDIEAGEYQFDPTLAVLVVGREVANKEMDGVRVGYNWSSHGLGKCGFFDAKGLLAMATSKFSDWDGD